MENKFKFAIVIATYNSAEYISRCIDSILVQGADFEIVIVDNCSSDNTAAIVSNYKNAGIKFSSEKDNGVFDAWNKGLKACSAEWIIFLGADDYFSDAEALLNLQACVSQPNAHKVHYGAISVVDSNRAVIAHENASWDLIADRLRFTLPFTHVGTAHHRSIFEHKNFDSGLKIAGDYEFLYPELRQSGAAYCSNYRVSMQTGGLSRSIKNRVAMLKELNGIWKKHDTRPGAFIKIKAQLKYVVFLALMRINPAMKF